MNSQDQPSAETYSDSQQLYAACLSRDTAVQAGAYRTLWQYLYRIALQIVYDQPAGDALAQDHAQKALLRIHGRIGECNEPAAFRTWARRIVSHIAIDDLRRRKRLLPLEAAAVLTGEAGAEVDTHSLPEKKALRKLSLAELRQLLSHAPISDRSRRLIIGRYLDDEPDETLAGIESELAGQVVQPSHIQVTRSKNISKLRRWELLQAFVAEGQS